MEITRPCRSDRFDVLQEMRGCKDTLEKSALRSILKTLSLLTTDPLGFGVYGIAVSVCLSGCLSVCLSGPKIIKAFLNKMKANLKEKFLRILEAPNSFKAWIK